MSEKEERKGWVCPVCGKVHSPDVTECSECNGKLPKVVYVPYPYPINPFPLQPYAPTWYRCDVIEPHCHTSGGSYGSGYGSTCSNRTQVSNGGC